MGKDEVKPCLLPFTFVNVIEIIGRFYKGKGAENLRKNGNICSIRTT